MDRFNACSNGTDGASGAVSDWQEIHRRVVRVAGAKAALDEEQGRLLLEALRADVHSRLGCATFVEYVERLFGCGPRETEERLRVARALEGLPAMATALREGGLCWSDLMILLCGKHHRLVHRGSLIIDGWVSQGLRFYHADGSVYGHPAPDLRAIECFERAFSALRGLGFKNGETKRALAEVRPQDLDANVEVVVRAALGVLTRPLN